MFTRVAQRETLNAAIAQPVAVLADCEKQATFVGATLDAHGIELAAFSIRTRLHLGGLLHARYPRNPLIAAGLIRPPVLTGVVDTLVADPSVGTVLLAGRPSSLGFADPTTLADLHLLLSQWHRVHILAAYDTENTGLSLAAVAVPMETDLTASAL